jgi:serine/threonine protein kinase
MDIFPAPVLHAAMWVPHEETLLNYEGRPLQPDDNFDLLTLRHNDEGAPIQAYAVSRSVRPLELRDGRGFVCTTGILCQHHAGDPPGTFRAPLHRHHDEGVAIKIIHRHLEAEPMDGFVTVAVGHDSIHREMYYVQTYGDNENFIKPIECLQDDDHIYQVTPAGLPFARNVYAQWQTLTDDLKMHFFYQMLKILLYSQMCGIHLRDIKPDNFVVLNGGLGPLVAIDLGMCVRMPRDAQGRIQPIIPQDGAFGTPHYMAPEISHQEAFYDGTAADLWAVLMIFLELHLGPQPMARAAWDDQGYTLMQTALTLVDVYTDIDAVNAWLMEENFPQVDRDAILPVCQALYQLRPDLRRLVRHGLCHDHQERWTLAQVLVWAHMD